MGNADTKSANRNNRIICVPFSQEIYCANIQDAKTFRKCIDECVRSFPELFPPEISKGYRMKDICYSKKQAIPIRRFDIGGISHTLRPSFIMPYMTGVVGEIEKALFMRNFYQDFFGIEIVKGLSDYLLGQSEISDILVNPGIERLAILPAGKLLSNSAELLGSTRMEVLANDIRSRYRSDRIVLVDSPSLLCTDSIILSNYVDGILLVVEDEKTSADDIKRMMELL
jgi:hypothetical protein